MQQHCLPEQWKGYDLAQKKFVDPDLTFWLRDNLCTDEQEPIVEVTWDERLAQMSRLSTFEQLVANVNSNPLPDFEGVPNVNMTEADKANLDFVALHHLPNDAPDGFIPISIEGDGNCFPRTVSYILQKDQAHHKEIHVRIVYEAVQVVYITVT